MSGPGGQFLVFATMRQKAGQGRRRTPLAQALLVSTALAAGLALGDGPVWADGGNGGNIGGVAGGLGGVDGSLTSATGQDSLGGASGGGGAVDLTTGFGAPGGARGTPETVGATGAAGQVLAAPTSISTAISGGNGSAGNTANQGGGGGGVGVGTTADVTITATGTVTGGAGFAQGNSSGGGGGVGVFSSANVSVEAGGQVTGGAGGGGTIGGGGGAGAAAIVLTNGGTVQNSGTLVGGAGGRSFVSGGGDGGAGVQLLAGGTIINAAGGTITGGAGGQGRVASAAPGTTPGDGGAGIKGANIAIINAGTITGGAGGTGTGWTPVAGQAIQFTGGVNSLEIWSSSTISGNVAAFSTADTFKLGGSTDAAFDLSQIGAGAKYQGFGFYEKTGTSTWTLTGTTTAVTPWTLTGGALELSSDSMLGDPSGGLTFNGGVLRVTGTSFTSTARAITWGAGGGGFDIADAANSFTVGQDLVGGGPLTKLGAGTLVLTGDNSYTGGTTISAGTLQLGDGGATGSIVGNIANDGMLVFNRSNAMTIGGAISGNGAVEQIGTGTTILTNTNNYTGGTTITAGTLQLGNGGTSGSITGDVANNGVLAFNRSDDVTFAGQITGTGAVHQIGSGKTTLTGDSSGLTGVSQVQAGTLSVNGILGGTLEVLSGGRLQGTGQVGDTTNFAGGIIAPGNSIGTLLVAGDYAGSGGTLEMEAVLSGTGSPADRLVITGNATGTTSVHVTNLGGTGAATGSGNTDGISIVQVGGTSTASAFQLQGGYAAAGPYQYHLTAFDPASSAASEGDALLGGSPFWDYRLQSAVDANGNAIPVPQIGAYQSLPSGALRYGASQLDSLHERLGEIQHLASYRTAGQGDSPTGEFFLRQQGSRGDVSGDKGPDYDQDIWFVQFGGNLVGWDVGNPGASLRGGLAVSVGGSNLDMDGSSAEVDLQGTGLALTLTYQAASGWYLDAVAQGTRYTADVTTAERGTAATLKGWGYGASLEAGYPLDLGNRLLVEPQAQLAYQQVSFDTFTDVDGIATDLQDGSSLQGRIGGRVQKTFASEIELGTALWSPFIEANLLHEFMDGDGITASGVTFTSDIGGTSVQFGGGLNAQLGPNLALFARVGYEKAVSDGAADSWTGAAGLRMNF